MKKRDGEKERKGDRRWLEWGGGVERKEGNESRGEMERRERERKRRERGRRGRGIERRGEEKGEEK